MRKLYPQSTVYPDKPAKDYNDWQSHLEKEREKLSPRYVEKKKLKKVA